MSTTLNTETTKTPVTLAALSTELAPLPTVQADTLAATPEVFAEDPATTLTAAPEVTATADAVVAPEVVAAPVAALAMAAPAPVATATAITQQAAPLGLGTMTPSTTGTLPMIGALLLVVGLILGLGKLVKRVQKGRAGEGATLQVKGGVQIGAKERVVWMQAGDTHLLLGVSPGRVQTLHVFEVPPDLQTTTAANDTAEAQTKAAAETPATRDFSDRLKNLLAHARAKGLDTEVSVPVAAAPVIAPSIAAAATKATGKPNFSFRA